MAPIALAAIASAAACGYPPYAFQDGADAAGPPDDSGAPRDAGDESDVSSDGPEDAIDSSAHDVASPDAALDAALDDSGHDNGPDAAPPCAITIGGDLRTSIPRFGLKPQVVDGIGDEFCDVPATRWVATAGAMMDPTPPPSGVGPSTSR